MPILTQSEEELVVDFFVSLGFAEVPTSNAVEEREVGSRIFTSSCLTRTKASAGSETKKGIGQGRFTYSSSRR